MGEGAYYAPDLTKITQLRGTPYLTAFLKDPSQFYDEEQHRRLMPNPNLNDQEISDVIAFMDWVANVDNQGWPPRPILVSGSSLPGTDLTVAQQAGRGAELPPGAVPVRPDNDPIALGEAVFRSAVPACTACHSVAPGVNLQAPPGRHVVSRPETIDSSLHQWPRHRRLYRESLLSPALGCTPGPMYSANGVSFMPATYGQDLTPEQIDHLVAYLASFK